MLDYQNSSISSIRTGSCNLEWTRKKLNTIDGTEQYVDKHTNRKQLVIRQLKTIGAQFLFVVTAKNSGKVKIINGLLRYNAKLIHHINNHILPKSLNSTPHSLVPTFNLKPKTRKCLLKIKRKWQSHKTICYLSVPPGVAIHEPTRRALICQVSSSPTVVTDHQGAHAIPAHMPKLLTVPTYNVTVVTSASAAMNSTTSPLSQYIGSGALPGHMPRYIAHVADGFIWAITRQVTCLPTVVACLLICAVNCNMTLLVTVVAQPQVPRRHWGGSAVSSTVSSLATGVADAFVWAVIGHVTRFTAIPT